MPGGSGADSRSVAERSFVDIVGTASFYLTIAALVWLLFSGFPASTLGIALFFICAGATAAFLGWRILIDNRVVTQSVSLPTLATRPLVFLAVALCQDAPTRNGVKVRASWAIVGGIAEVGLGLAAVIARLLQATWLPLRIGW
jgi:hypothetical protein